MDDLLKEAIADAKAVRETALENAKIALEEAFTPRLQSMLSKKIQSEIEEDEMEDDEDMEERGDMMDDDEEMEERGAMNDDDEDPADEDSEMDEMGHEDDEEKMDMENVIEIDGVKYAPVVSEEEDEEDPEEAMHDEDEEMDESDELDLEAVLRELETEVNEGEDEDEDKMDEGEHEDDEEKDEVKENDVSSGIGKSDNAHDKKSGDSTDIGKAGKAKHESVEVSEGEHEDDEEKDESVEEEIDLEEVLKALTEEEDEKKETNEVSKLQSELDEHRNVVKYLRSKLNEVNLLNAKLLFTNKLFRSYGLSNEQKMKVVETFDRAHNLREVKLVYSTLAESFGSKNNKTEIKESKGKASKAVASTKSKKQEVIAEGHEMRDRFKKLAGIL